MKRAGSVRSLARLAALALLAVLGCAARPPHIPEREPLDRPSSVGQSTPDASVTIEERTETDRMRMPPSRAGVLDVLSLFQSSIQNGEPPLGELLAESASLTAPGTDSSRAAPSRSAIVGALGANFADPTLGYDPFDAVVRPSDEGAIATVLLEPTTESSPRRIVLSLHVGYSDDGLRIKGIALSRAP